MNSTVDLATITSTVPTLMIPDSPVPQDKLDVAISQVAQGLFNIIMINKSALSKRQIQLLTELCDENKGAVVFDLQGGLIGRINSCWSVYQDYSRPPRLRPSPTKAIEIYRDLYHELPKIVIDFGAGPGENTIPLLEMGIEFVYAIDCDPLVIRDFYIRLGNLNLGHLKERVTYLTTEFDQWDTDVQADLVVANYTWPWRPPNKFDDCWKKTHQVVRQGGLICGEFYEKPPRKQVKKTMTYHTRKQVVALLKKDWNLLWMEEPPLKRSHSDYDLQEAAKDKELEYGGLIRIVAQKK